jgi:hypothetical protein
MGIAEKLRDYVLVPAHGDNNGKANGFAQRLGIDIGSAEHLEHVLRAGIVRFPTSAVRLRPYGLSCAVEFEILGIGRYSDRKSTVRTIWHFQAAGDRPRHDHRVFEMRRK